MIGTDSNADFEGLYRQHYGLVAATVAKFRFTNGAADDLIQETFLQVWKSLSSLRDPQAFKGWVVTIARNKCIRALQKQRDEVSVSPTDRMSDEDGPAEVVLVADDIHTSLHLEQSVTLIRGLIEAHEGEPRATVARMFYLEQIPTDTIAARLDMKPSTVRSHLRRFRLIITEAAVALMEENGIEF